MQCVELLSARSSVCGAALPLRLLLLSFVLISTAYELLVAQRPTRGHNYT